jgi:hypothetical protein
MEARQEYDGREFVLGRVTGSELEHAEERFIGEAEFFERVMAEEESLIQEYVAGRLTGRDRNDFERQCAWREDLRTRVALERELPEALRGLSTTETPRAAGWRVYRMALPVAAALALAMTGVAGFLFFQLQQQSRIATAREQVWQKRDGEQKERIARLEGAGREDGQLLALLIPPSTRAEDAPTYTVPLAVNRVALRFNIGVDTAYRSYRVTVQSAGIVVATAAVNAEVIEGRRVVAMTIPVLFSGRRVFDAVVRGVSPGAPEIPIETYAFALSR